MCIHTETDFELLYGQLICQRRKEYQLLRECMGVLADLYIELLEKTGTYRPDSPSEESQLCNKALLMLSKLMDSFLSPGHSIDTPFDLSSSMDEEPPHSP